MESEKTLIKNINIMTFDEKNSYIKNGSILINNGIIEKLLSKEETEDYFHVIDGKGRLVMPGFISMHTHLYSTFARGMDLKGKKTRNFEEILNNLWWSLDDNLLSEDIYYSALVHLIESIKSGVTCLFDHHASYNCIDGSLDILEEAMNKVNLRGALSYEVSDRRGYEKANKAILENVRFISKRKKNHMIKGLFGLHASYTLSDNTLYKAASLGNSLNCGFHIHVAEGDIDSLKTMESYKTSIVKRLHKAQIINNKSLFVHCLHIEEDEFELLRNGNIIHNPESNMNNAAGYLNLPFLLRENFLVGLGTDGFTSDLLREIRTAYLLHKHEMKDPCALTSKDVIKTAIYNNSKIASKFYENPVGVIKEGAKADIIFLDYLSPTEINSINFCDHIIFGLSKSNIKDVMVDGKFIMKHSKILNLCEEEIYAKAREISKKLWERI